MADPQQLWPLYKRSLEEHPVRTKMATSVALTLFGNFLTQKIIERKPNFDFKRALGFMLFTAILTPVSHRWYAFLDAAFPNSKKDGKSAKEKKGLDRYVDTNILKKLALDELVYDPFVLLFFFTYVGVLEGKSLGEISQTIKSQWWVTQKASWRLWPVAQLLNFSFVPSNLRLPFMNFVSFFWAIFLQTRASADRKTLEAGSQ